MTAMRMVPLFFLLMGCGGLVDLGPKGPADVIYRLEPLERGADQPEGPLVYVEEPEVSGALDTMRIAIEDSPRSYAYLAGARWEERTPLLLQRHIARSLDNQPGLQAVGALNFDLPVALRLKLDIRDFEARRTAGGNPEVFIAMVAVLSDATSSKMRGNRYFEQKEQASGTDAAAIVAAYNTALDRLVRELAAWLAAAPATDS